MTTDRTSPLIRRATPADAADLARLRVLMLQAMGSDVGDASAPWRAAMQAWFAEQLTDNGTMFAGFVVDDPELGVVSNAVGLCSRHAPSPMNLAGIRGEIFNVSTDPRRRRQGLARLCVVALLDWFDKETDATLIKLNATSDGIDLYRSLGFTVPRFAAMQLRLSPPA